METKIQKQWSIIKDLDKIFEDNNTQYHFDGSTAVFVHGIDKGLPMIFLKKMLN